MGITSVVVGGRFNPDTWYQIIEKYNVSVWYSAPTAFRMLMGANEEVVNRYDLSSLRHILSVGEPLNPEVIRWAIKVFKLPIYDTWFMTETGAQIICNYPCMNIRLGSMGRPIPGTVAAILDDEGNELPPLTKGNLAKKKDWASIMRRIWQNKEKYDSYFINDWFVSGDSAYMDEDGYFWFQGRTDDVINSAGEMIGPFEIECKLIEHPAISEAGVIGKPDTIRGQIIKAFITLKHGYTPSEELKKEICHFVKTGLAANSAPREIEFIDNLPKTKSGKIMRAVLTEWELNLPVNDLSNIED